MLFVSSASCSKETPFYCTWKGFSNILTGRDSLWFSILLAPFYGYKNVALMNLGLLRRAETFNGMREC